MGSYYYLANDVTGPHAEEVKGQFSSYGLCADEYQVKNGLFIAPFLNEHDDFTKTGSGQTQGKLKKRPLCCRPSGIFRRSCTYSGEYYLGSMNPALRFKLGGRPILSAHFERSFSRFIYISPVFI